MDSSSTSKQGRKPPSLNQLDIYSTVVFHGTDAENEQTRDAVSVSKGDASLESVNDTPSVGGTMIVKTNRRRPRSETMSFLDRTEKIRKSRTGEIGEEGVEEGDFSTFVMRDGEIESGTVVRRTSGRGTGEESGLSTMRRAVASMQSMEEIGAGRKRKGGNGGALEEEMKQVHGSKVSSSSFPDSVAREDPSTKYEILHELGKGSYGAVYKARDLKTSEMVAIKVISLSEGEEGYEDILGEIEMLQQCSHPNVIRYFASYQGDEYLWIVMEYCGCGSVAGLMNVNEAPLEEHQIAYICKETLKGLSYLHSIFKVHRDIKGGNILLTDQGEVKLGDFGVAAQLTRTMSKRNTFIGTPHWMAPEVIQESRYDGKVDVWALGISAIEMAEGLPPRATVHPMRVLFMISREPAPMLEDKEKWSLLFHDFVAMCLTKDPRLRPTAAELLKHKFIEKCKSGASGMLPRIQQAKEIRSSMALEAQKIVSSATLRDLGGDPKVNESFGDTVPAGLQVSDVLSSAINVENHDSVHIETDEEGDFGTMIVRDASNTATTATQIAVRDKEPSPSVEPTGNAHVPGHEEKTIDPRLYSEESLSSTSGTSQSGQGKASSPAMLAPPLLSPPPGNIFVTKGPLKSEAVSQKAVEKLRSIYSAGITVPIPFVRASDISPIALLSGNMLGAWQEDDTLHELFCRDAQSKKGRSRQNEVPLPPSVHQRLSSSPTLMNLTQALAYHRMCYDDMPLQEMQATQEQKTIQSLCDTLKTILRL
ncbi:unnamed protein product [Cuscuta epithymum]|uniref:non-specific serine/threonine protein kinase n=1 Tax=Cuscuta epithymum TaxID=186058 RepID=A0AAV0DYF0_9ASTE|nr:unnamed protein product [Cuscuta epithymum]